MSAKHLKEEISFYTNIDYMPFSNIRVPVTKFTAGKIAEKWTNFNSGQSLFFGWSMFKKTVSVLY